MYFIGVYVGRFECILCIAYSHYSHSYGGDFGHLLQSCSSSPLSTTSSSYCFLSFYLAIVALDVVCIPASHLSASGRACSGSGRRRRGRLGCRNVSVFSGIKQRNAGWLSFLAHVIPLAYFSGEFEWLIHSGDSCAVVLAKTTEFKLAT